MSRRKTTQQFIEEAKQVHGDKYCYDGTVYVNCNTKVEIVCKEHGKFFQRPDTHIIGRGCPKCAYSSKRKLRSNTQGFINKANKIHNNKYKYDKVDYIKSNLKVIITCLEHGDFLQAPNSHLNGNGCPKCSYIANANKKIKNTEWFLNKANQVHGNKYIYDKVVYKKIKDKVIIICPKHGEFLQTPDDHLHGKGCKYCGIDSSVIKKTKSSKDFIFIAKKIHNDFYNYDKVVYINTKSKITITCPIHGDFLQTPDDHLCGKGCKFCTNQISRPEQDICRFFTEQGIDYIQSDRSIIKPYELDIVIPQLKLAIEYCGLYWHSESRISSSNRIISPNKLHESKTYLAKQKGYQLLTIFEPEWLLKKDIIKSILLSKCNIYNIKLGARKCSLEQLDIKTAKAFFNTHHIQGFASGKHFGLFYEDELVSAITFIKYFNEVNLVRFVNKKHYLVHGAFSKLLKYYIKNYKPKIITTFADKRYFTGEVYKINGFKFLHDVNPSYYYFKTPTDLLHKRNFQHKNLKKFFENYDPKLTEYQNCLNNGYDRIWDCGKIKYLLEVIYE